MITEIEVLREHIDRYRAVTLQFLETVSTDQLRWRPNESSFSVGEHLQHIAQTEDYYRRGLFDGEWEPSHLRLTEAAHDADGLRTYFAAVRREMGAALDEVTSEDLSRLMTVPHAPGEFPLRWWLWFLLEHEVHHKGQLAVYLKQMGLVAPFYAMPLPAGARPDIAARADLQAN